MGRGRGESSWYACAWSRGYSLVADGPLEPDALLALEEALRVDLRLDRLEPREAVRAPDALLQREALLLLLGVRKRYRTKLGVVGLEGPELVICDVVVLGASEDLALGSRRVERRDLRTVLRGPRSTTRVLFLGSSASCSFMALFG